MNDTDELTKEELEVLEEILNLFARQTERDTAVKWINGGYAEAKVFNVDEETISIELEWGEQDMGNGRSYAHKSSHELSRDLLLLDIDIMEKVAQIK